MTKATMSDRKTRRSELGIVSTIISPTGRFEKYDSPKSKSVTTPPRKSQYRVHSDWSRPSSPRISASISSVAIGPAITSSGLLGIALTIRNVNVVMAHSATGIKANRRRT